MVDTVNGCVNYDFGHVTQFRSILFDGNVFGKRTINTYIRTIRFVKN